MIYLIIGLTFSLFMLYSVETSSIAYPKEFSSEISKFLLFGMIAFSWPFVIGLLIMSMKNNS